MKLNFITFFKLWVIAEIIVPVVITIIDHRTNDLAEDTVGYTFLGMMMLSFISTLIFLLLVPVLKFSSNHTIGYKIGLKLLWSIGGLSYMVFPIVFINCSALVGKQLIVISGLYYIVICWGIWFCPLR